jgi:hypothetical protein
MTWNFADSFDFYNTGTDMALSVGGAGWDTAASLGLVSTPTRFAVGQSLEFFFGGQATKAVTNNDQTHHLVFAWDPCIGNTGKHFAAFTLFDTTFAQCTVSLTADGTITLYSGAGAAAAGGGSGAAPAGTLLATYSASLPANTWTGLEIEIVISNTTGGMTVRKNGNTSNDFTVTGLNTRNGSANSYANKLQISDQGGSYQNSLRSHLDDFMWFTTAGSAPNTWVGDIRAYQRMPSADGTVALTRLSGTTNVSMVNQAIEDADTTYVSGATAATGDLYTVTATPAGVTGIVAVVTKMMAKKSDSGAKTASVQMKSGATTSLGTAQALSTGYLYASRVNTVDPNTSAAWTLANVNAAQVGPYVVS